MTAAFTEVIYKAEATTGEGSIWHPDRQTLFWVDIEGQSCMSIFQLKRLPEMVIRPHGFDCCSRKLKIRL